MTHQRTGEHALQAVQDPPIVAWPEEGVRRIPYAVYSSPAVFEQEQKSIFSGPIWHFLGLEAQLPEPGCYVMAQMGRTPIVVVRNPEGEVNAFVNRCSHKGTPLVFTPSGKLKRFMCIYHNWCFNLDGNLTSAAFERGIQGKGGMASSFKKEDNGLQKVRVHTLHGLIFGTLSDDTPPFEDYVGHELIANIARVCGRPLRVLGQYSQRLPSNWKLYIENVKDPYHASILHAFNGVMKQDRLTMEGGIVKGTHGWSHISYSKMKTDTGDDTYKADSLRAASITEFGFGLRDTSITDVWDDFGDSVSMTIQTVFPNFVLQQLRNSLAVRTIVPIGTHASELRWTAFGFVDDDEQKLQGRLKQANMMGPAGFIAMEDGMIGGLVQQGIAGSLDKAAVIEMGGHGIDPIPGSRLSEGSVRGFWTGYRALMGF
ncbi:Rieske 2Fe-2S domain-containing protein [Hydrogenophaga sp.]|uniref:aromatic ring-hydroxylating oxygenase subunit alpha n=1 Tax=Hydrogenophaga sp. TaxID=1904254 RepID=UPI0027198F52|nr:Rieske 2Fe-2S domain-containing protein [Hydrogenophaga sp.]MDO9434194.1 Rieske 2Fe-2S domain-containing protein [Hydrogenophaga sp.]